VSAAPTSAAQGQGGDLGQSGYMGGESSSGEGPGFTPPGPIFKQPQWVTSRTQTRDSGFRGESEGHSYLPPVMEQPYQSDANMFGQGMGYGGDGWRGEMRQVTLPPAGNPQIAFPDESHLPSARAEKKKSGGYMGPTCPAS